MDRYEWQVNEAVVKRLYYTERLWETTFLFAGMYTLANSIFVRQNYFRATMQSRLLPVWGRIIAFNSLITFILVKPLTPDERRIQIRKRLAMRKWLYTLYHLDEENQKYAPTKLI